MAGSTAGGSAAETVGTGSVGGSGGSGWSGGSGGIRRAEATAAARRAVGAYGERVAVRLLTEAGMRVVDRNWRCREGEIDIVALDGDCLVFCEVKTRRGSAYGGPAEAVTRAKAARLRRLAGAWLTAHAEGSDGFRRFGDVRIDVIAVTRPRAGAAQVEHLRAVC